MIEKGRYQIQLEVHNKKGRANMKYKQRLENVNKMEWQAINIIIALVLMIASICVGLYRDKECRRIVENFSVVSDITEW